jgi:AcrR family transcriptional regulator
VEVDVVSDKEAAGRECLLDQAQRLFFAHGYSGTSVRDIVQACGLSNGALYYHFGSKQNLFIQVFKEYVATATRQIDQARARQGSCRERLAAMADAYAQFIVESRSELQTLHRDLVQCGDERIKGLLPQTVWRIPSRFAEVLEEGIAAGEVRPVDTEQVSMLLLGMIKSVTMRRMFGPVDRSRSEDIDLAIDILFEGIDKPS